MTATADEDCGGAAKAALLEFYEAVTVTGGLTENDDGEEAPCADEEWVDLAPIYRRAAAALGLPVVYEWEEE